MTSLRILSSNHICYNNHLDQQRSRDQEDHCQDNLSRINLKFKIIHYLNDPNIKKNLFFTFNSTEQRYDFKNEKKYFFYGNKLRLLILDHTFIRAIY